MVVDKKNHRVFIWMNPDLNAKLEKHKGNLSKSAFARKILCEHFGIEDKVRDASKGRPRKDEK